MSALIAPKKTITLSRTTTLAVTAMFIVLVFVFTRIGFTVTAFLGTYVHLGNIPLFIAAILFGRKVGMIAGGVGMALFDATSPFVAWAPFTLVIVALMGYVTGLIAERHNRYSWYILAVGLSIVIKLAGYYIADGIIVGNWLAPMASIPSNALQVIVGAVVALAILRPLELAARKAFRQPAV